MYQLILALLLACASPAHHTDYNNGQVTVTIHTDTDPTGDDGHFPPPPPPPGGH